MNVQRSILCFVGIACALIASHDLQAARGGRAGGGGGFGGGGGARPNIGGGGGGARPNIGGGGGGARPNIGGGGGAGARPNIGGGGSGARPNIGGGAAAARPNISLPSGGAARPAVPPAVANRPAQNISRSNVPEINRPSGGLRPSTRPGGGGLGSGGGDGGIVNRPATRPNLPNIGGGNRPGTSVPGIGDRPGIGNRPGGEGIAGGGKTGGGNIGGGKIGGGNIGGGKIGGDGLGKIGRPLPGDVGDFLGMPGLRPDPGFTRPGGKEGGNIVGKFPGGKDSGNIGGKLPGGDNRPFPDRRPDRDRPVNIGDRINTNINVRPQWANINNVTINNIQNNWTSVIKNQPTFNNWLGRHPDRNNFWNRWGNNVRDRWSGYGRQNGWFNQTWWEGHNHAYCGWHYHHRWYNHNWSYWWRVPVWSSFSTWFTWSAAPTTVWAQPIFYDFGTGGNVVFQDNSVYIGGQQVASAADFAASAAALATVPPPASQAEAEKADWMALGTFAVAANEKDVDPSRVIQLAVDRQGIISGTLFNQETDKAQTVQGQVDKQTQRVAFRIGDSDKIVVETGLYNLTQEQAPVLVHFGADKTETYLLVRLKQPDDEDQPKS